MKRTKASLLKTKDQMMLDVDRLSTEAMRAILKAAIENQSQSVLSITYEQIAEHLKPNDSRT